jgi:hypothetical protein
MDEQSSVVDRVLDFVKDERGGSDRVLESRRVNRDTFSGAKTCVALTLKRRTRKNQREVDVKENGTNRQGMSFDWLIAAAVAF